MSIIKLADSKSFIPSNMFDICYIDGLSKSEICQKYTRSDLKRKSAYFLDKFNFHLKTCYQIDIREYCIKYLKIQWPTCPVDGQLVGYKIAGKGIFLSTYHARGTTNKANNPNFAAFCEKMKTERKGAGNPMFEATPWNKGETKETNPRIKAISEKMTGRKVSPEQCEKIRQIMLASPLKARHTQKHSPETIEKLRENTARLWREGRFSGRKTGIEEKVENFLNEIKDKLTSKFEIQHQIKYFTYDLAFPEAKLGIECQGGWYHVDPRLHPNGAKHDIQRRNLIRDKAKKTFTKTIGWTILELWETEINNGEFKEILLCKLRELNLIKE